MVMAARPTRPSFAVSQRASGDALGPDEAEGAGFEFAGDQGGAEEQPEQGGGEDDEQGQRSLQRPVERADRVVHRVAVPGRLACGLEGIVDMREVHPGDGERDRERGESAERDDRFGAELAKRQPDHGRISSLGGRFCSAARVR